MAISRLSADTKTRLADLTAYGLGLEACSKQGGCSKSSVSKVRRDRGVHYAAYRNGLNAQAKAIIKMVMERKITASSIKYFMPPRLPIPQHALQDVRTIKMPKPNKAKKAKIATIGARQYARAAR